MDNNYIEEFFLFDNRLKLTTQLYEMGRMSHWVRGFKIENFLNGEEIINQIYGPYDLGEFSENENLLEINFRIYPNGSPSYKVNLNLFEKTYHYNNQVYNLNDFIRNFKYVNSIKLPKFEFSKEKV